MMKSIDDYKIKIPKQDVEQALLHHYEHNLKASMVSPE